MLQGLTVQLILAIFGLGICSGFLHGFYVYLATVGMHFVVIIILFLRFH